VEIKRHLHGERPGGVVLGGGDVDKGLFTLQKPQKMKKGTDQQDVLGKIQKQRMRPFRVPRDINRVQGGLYRGGQPDPT